MALFAFWGIVNVLSGFFGNLVVGLICKVGTFELRRWRHILVAGAGALLMAVMLARALGKFYDGPTMSITTCPTDIIAASAERIWDLLTQPRELAAWADAKLIDGPDRELTAGDRVVLGPGFGIRVTFEVRGAEKPRQLRIDVQLPLGVINHEVVQISPVDERRCRVTFN